METEKNKKTSNWARTPDPESKARIERKGDMPNRIQKNNRKKPAKKGFKAKMTALKEKWNGLSKWRKAIIIAVIVLVLVIVAAIVSVWAVYSGFQTDIDENNLGISDDIYNHFGDTDIINVAVFGIDTRDENSFKGRSDSIIIVSLNPVEKTVKLTSILRDSYVAIEGHKNQKITHAYMFGGAELAIKTLNQNYHLNIKDYATINFYKLAEAIDVLGGVDVEITESEMRQINDIGDDEGKIIEQVTEYGHVHLNGDQAAVFVRLRKFDSDVARSNRQRMVINALLDQARKVKPTEYAKVVKTIMSLCETSLSFSEVMSLVPLINENVTIQTLVVPNEEEAIGGVYEGAWVWRYDLNEASQKILEFIYGESPEFSYNSNDLFTTKPSDSNKTDSTYKGVTINRVTDPVTRKETTTQERTVTNPPKTEPVTEPATEEKTTESVLPPATEPSTHAEKTSQESGSTEPNSQNNAA